MNRAALVFAVAMAIGPGAMLAQARGLLEICTDEEGAAEVLQRLDGWMSTVRIGSRPARRCDEPAPHYLGRFERSASGTDFVLRNSQGGILRHPIPWIGPTATPLSEIDALQRLPQFSLLLESLLAEDRLGLAAPPPAPPEAPRAPPRRTGPRSRPPRPPPPPEPPPEPATAEEPTPPPPIIDLRPDPEEEEVEAPVETPPPMPDEMQSRPLLEDFREPPLPWGWGGEAFASVRGRSPDFLGPEVGLGLVHGPLSLRLGVQIPTRWYLGHAPIGVGSFWLAPGIAQDLAIGGAALRLGLGVTVEAVMVRRLGLPWAESQVYLDAGPSLAAELRWPLFGGRIGIGAEVGGMPTARNLRLPEGDEARLGPVWGRFSIGYGFGE